MMFEWTMDSVRRIAIDRIAPAEVRIQMGKADRHLDRYYRRVI